VEAAPVVDGQDYRRCGLDAGSRHGHQDPGKREVVQELFDFAGHDGPLEFEFLDLGGDARDDEFDGFGSGDGYRLLAQSGEHGVNERRRVFAAVAAGPAQYVPTSGGTKAGRARVFDEHLQDKWTGQDGAGKGAFQGREDLQQHMCGGVMFIRRERRTPRGSEIPLPGG
jgi:hypothetical protein